MFAPPTKVIVTGVCTGPGAVPKSAETVDGAVEKMDADVDIEPAPPMCCLRARYSCRPRRYSVTTFRLTARNS